MSFQQKIELVRKSLNLSQEDLAREIGVSFATVNRWQNKGSKPSRLALKAFNNFCERNSIDFYGEGK